MAEKKDPIRTLLETGRRNGKLTNTEIGDAVEESGQGLDVEQMEKLYEELESSGIEVAIVCRKTDRQVLDIVARLRMFDRKVTGSADGGTHVVNAEDILYVESVDKRTFFYTEGAVFETALRLYEMEERLEGCDFLRVAKGCVVNFRRIASLRPEMNGRLVATMDNGEQVVISRQYAPDVRRKLGML